MLECDNPEYDGLNWASRSQPAIDCGDEKLLFSSRADVVQLDGEVSELGFVLTDQAMYYVDGDSLQDVIRREEITNILDIFLFDSGMLRLESSEEDMYFRTTLLPRDSFLEAFSEILPIEPTMIDPSDADQVSEIPSELHKVLFEDTEVAQKGESEFDKVERLRKERLAALKAEPDKESSAPVKEEVVPQKQGDEEKEAAEKERQNDEEEEKAIKEQQQKEADQTRLAEEAAAEQKQREEEAIQEQQQQEAEQIRLAEEAAEQKQREEEAIKEQQQKEAEQIRLAEEAASEQKQREEEAIKEQQQQEAEQVRLAEEAAAEQKQREEEEAAKKQEEDARLAEIAETERLEKEAAERQQLEEETAAREAAEAQRKEEEERLAEEKRIADAAEQERLQQEAAEAQRKAEEEKQRQAEEARIEEEKRKREAAEREARLAEERRIRDEERRKREEELERQRLIEEEEQRKEMERLAEIAARDAAAAIERELDTTECDEIVNRSLLISEWDRGITEIRRECISIRKRPPGMNKDTLLQRLQNKRSDASGDEVKRLDLVISVLNDNTEPVALTPECDTSTMVLDGVFGWLTGSSHDNQNISFAATSWLEKLYSDSYPPQQSVKRVRVNDKPNIVVVPQSDVAQDINISNPAASKRLSLYRKRKKEKEKDLSATS